MPAVKLASTPFAFPVKQAVVKSAAPRPKKQPVDIIDIRSNKVDFDLKDEVARMISPADGGARKLPTLLLYDERGLQLFEDVGVTVPKAH
jgi:hypothetical protein